jgi:hypothetical protein
MSTRTVRVVRDTDGRHKFKAIFPEGRTVHFGARGYSDYTMHKDSTRMKRYVIRHRRRENWGRSGRYTPGFWSRWLLWSSPTMNGALARTQRVLGRRIIFGASSK